MPKRLAAHQKKPKAAIKANPLATSSTSGAATADPKLSSTVGGSSPKTMRLPTEESATAPVAPHAAMRASKLSGSRS
jgi:hypothetical protein